MLNIYFWSKCLNITEIFVANLSDPWNVSDKCLASSFARHLHRALSGLLAPINWEVWWPRLLSTADTWGGVNFTFFWTAFPVWSLVEGSRLKIILEMKLVLKCSNQLLIFINCFLEPHGFWWVWSYYQLLILAMKLDIRHLSHLPFPQLQQICPLHFFVISCFSSVIILYSWQKFFPPILHYH